MYVVGFNGPPRSGKDTLAKMLVEHMESQGIILPTKEVSLSTPLRQVAYAMTGFTGELDGVPYEEFKNMYFPEFGKDGRHIMIDISESFLKPVYGQDIMAKMLLIDNVMFDGVLLIRDCGFQCEVNPVIEAVGETQFYLVNVMRPGKDFSNDSREWVNHPNSKCQMQVNNAGSLDDLAVEAGRIYGRLVNQMGWKF